VSLLVLSAARHYRSPTGGSSVRGSAVRRGCRGCRRRRAAVALDAWVAAVYSDVPLAEKDEAKRLGENKTCVERS